MERSWLDGAAESSKLPYGVLICERAVSRDEVVIEKE
jgi:hypothetical protein